MGLATISSHESFSKVDLNLSWYVPKEWSLEEAATVPYSYSQVSFVRAMDGLSSASFESYLLEVFLLFFSKHLIFIQNTVSVDC